MSSSVSYSFWARSIKGMELFEVMVSVLPGSPCRKDQSWQVAHVNLTDRAPGLRLKQAILVRIDDIVALAANVGSTDAGWDLSLLSDTSNRHRPC